MTTGSALKTAARLAFDKSGALHVARWMNRRGLRILTYHRFSERAPLARQCAHIRAHYAPVSMTQVADWLAHGGELPDNALAFTVDDGYRDFYQVAYPVLREYGIPATVYLVTDFLERSTWLWVDQVRYGFLHGKARRYRLERPGQPPLDFELGTPETRRAAARAVAEAAKRIPNAERLRLLAGLPEALEVDLPKEAPPEYAALHWDEVREMAATGIEFGAHTRRHPVLSRVSAESELAAEIGGSKLQIEQRLERPVQHFCYPNGAREDVGPQAVEAVRKAAFRTAVTMEAGLNHAGVDPFQLLRIGVDPGLEQNYFERCAAGFRK